MEDGEIVTVAEAGLVERHVDVPTSAVPVPDEVKVGFPQMGAKSAVLVTVDRRVEDSAFTSPLSVR